MLNFDIIIIICISVYHEHMQYNRIFVADLAPTLGKSNGKSFFLYIDLSTWSVLFSPYLVWQSHEQS